MLLRVITEMPNYTFSEEMHRRQKLKVKVGIAALTGKALALHVIRVTDKPERMASGMGELGPSRRWTDLGLNARARRL